MRNIHHISFEDVVNGAVALADKVKSKNWAIDVVVPLLKGGVALASMVGDNLDVNEYSCLHLKSAESSKTNAELKEPIFLGITNTEVLKGKNVLIVDDICDTGRSIVCAKKVLKEYGVNNIYVATLINVNEEFLAQPDYVYCFDYTKEKYWIVFPWEKE